MLLEEPPVLRAELRLDRVQVLADLVQDALQGLLILGAAVELVEHLGGVVDRRHGPVGAGIDHPGPRVGAIGNLDAELQRSEAGLRLGLGLEVVLDLLVDRKALGPAGGRVRAALDVAGEELDAREQAADAAHVAVAVAANLVANPMKGQHPLPEGLEGLEAFLEDEVFTLGVGPEVLGNDPVGAEHDDEALLRRRRLGGEAEAGQLREEGCRGGADAQVAQELAAALESHHGFFPWGLRAPIVADEAMISASSFRIL